MLPKTRAKERAHKNHIRLMEIDIIIESISNICKNNPDFINKNIDILEFGCGEGFQIPHIKSMGNVVASDIYTSDEIKSFPDLEFVECSITNTPFGDGRFDIVFSSHVVEHIADLPNALREIKRIGKSSCLYAFSVPTNIWLLLSIPAQYYNKLRKVIQIISSKLIYRSKLDSTKTEHNTGRSYKTDFKVVKYLRKFMPEGHGVNLNFIECYRNFMIKNWQRLFSDHGFSVIEVKPLLLYGPSEWPIIPTLRCKTYLCSSVLFLMRKQS